MCYAHTDGTAHARAVGGRRHDAEDEDGKASEDGQHAGRHWPQVICWPGPGSGVDSGALGSAGEPWHPLLTLPFLGRNLHGQG